MIALTYTLTLDQPVLATTPLGDINTAATLGYIPGSLVRGALIHRFATQPGQSAADLPHDGAARKLFFGDDARFLNAYPASPDGSSRSLPVPRSLRAARTGVRRIAEDAAADADAAVWHGAHPAVDLAAVEARLKDRLVALPADFGIVTGRELSLTAPRRLTTLHLHRDRDRTSDNQVFQYEALAAGQRFAGVVLVNDAAVADTIERLLGAGELSLGGSRTAQYGRVSVQVRRQPGWRETPAPRALTASQPHTLTLLSDALLRDSAGAMLQRLDAKAISLALDFPVELVEARCFVAGSVRGGFNGTWRLPLVQAGALLAGSVVAFRPRHDVPAATLTALIDRGIGERRAEGFGRLAFDWPIGDHFSAHRVRVPAEAPRVPKLAGHDLALARRLLKRIAEARLIAAIRGYVHAPGRLDAAAVADLDEVANSQLGRLAERVAQASHRAEHASLVSPASDTPADVTPPTRAATGAEAAAGTNAAAEAGGATEPPPGPWQSAARRVGEQFAAFPEASRRAFSRCQFDQQSLDVWIEKLLAAGGGAPPVSDVPPEGDQTEARRQRAAELRQELRGRLTAAGYVAPRLGELTVADDAELAARAALGLLLEVLSAVRWRRRERDEGPADGARPEATG